MATSQIKSDTNWGEAVSVINGNFASLNQAVEKAKAQTMIKLPLCGSESELYERHPPTYEDQMGLVGTTLPAILYKVKNGAWVSTGTSVGNPSAVLSEVVAYDSLGQVDEVTV
jgi:hypothetical protein